MEQSTHRLRPLIRQAILGAAYATGTGIVGLVFWWVKSHM